MTYFKIPTNNFYKINEKMLKIKFDTKKTSNSICSFSLNKYLNESKNIDDVSHL